MRIEGREYDIDGIRKRWGKCARTIGIDPDTNNPKERWLIMAEVEMRDWGWMCTGRVPKVQYASEEMRRIEEKLYPHEIEMSEKLSKHGIRCCLVDDNVPEIDEKGKKTGKSFNYADLSNGMELKRLDSASTYNTVNGHLKNASSKLNATSIVFDNSKNDSMTDAKLEEYILRSQAFHKGRIYILTKDDKLKRIR